MNAEQEFRLEVRALYRTLQAQGLSLVRDKGAVMRALSGRFRRDQMGRVYAALAGEEKRPSRASPQGA